MPISMIITNLAAHAYEGGLDLYAAWKPLEYPVKADGLVKFVTVS